MINKEAIEKVNNGILTADAINGQTTEDDALIEEVIRIFSQVKTLLKEQPEPKCKICGDKKPENYTQWLIELREEDKFLGHGVIKRTTNQKQELYKMYLESFHPCPACKEQPPASKLTKGLRQNVREFPDFPGHLWDLFERDILKVCDRLDASEASCKVSKELLTEYGRHSPGCSREFDKKYRCRCGWSEVEANKQGKAGEGKV